MQTWEDQMKEHFKIAEENTQKSADKMKRDHLKATLEALEVEGWVLVRNTTERKEFAW